MAQNAGETVSCSQVVRGVGETLRKSRSAMFGTVIISSLSAESRLRGALRRLLRAYHIADATLTVGKFQAGEAGNVIPEQAVMEGTLRVFDDDQRSYLVGRIREIVPAVAAAYRATARLDVLADVPELSNDEGLVGECLEAMVEAVPDLRPIGGLHAMGSEDFAVMSKRVPAAYFMLGAMPDDGGEPHSHHTPQVRFNEDELAIAAACYAASAEHWLEKHSKG